MRRTPTPTRLVVVMVATVGCGFALGACGSSAKKSNSASASQGGPLQFAECMRAHGVPNFPDPGSGGGIQITPGSGLNPRSPAFQAAQSTCFKLLPGGGRPRGNDESRHLQLLKLAQCMRAHGLTTFPDPTSGQPTGPPAGGGIAFGGPGGFLSIPQSLVQSPGFKQDAAACGFPGAGGPHGAQVSPAP